MNIGSNEDLIQCLAVQGPQKPKSTTQKPESTTSTPSAVVHKVEDAVVYEKFVDDEIVHKVVERIDNQKLTGKDAREAMKFISHR
jgi:hypothetical protein